MGVWVTYYVTNFQPGPPRSVGGSGPCAPSRFGVDTVDDSLDSFEDTPRFLALRNQKLEQKKIGVLYPRLPNTKGEVWYLDPQKTYPKLNIGFHDVSC